MASKGGVGHTNCREVTAEEAAEGGHQGVALRRGVLRRDTRHVAGVRPVDDEPRPRQPLPRLLQDPLTAPPHPLGYGDGN
jgi:hypothetical protein